MNSYRRRIGRSELLVAETPGNRKSQNVFRAFGLAPANDRKATKTSLTQRALHLRLNRLQSEVDADSDLWWHDFALCKGVPPEVFFPDREELGIEPYEDAKAAAKSICAQCPVLGNCADWAIENLHLIKFGIFAGMTNRERLEERERRRGYQTSDDDE